MTWTPSHPRIWIMLPITKNERKSISGKIQPWRTPLSSSNTFEILTLCNWCHIDVWYNFGTARSKNFRRCRKKFCMEHICGLYRTFESLTTNYFGSGSRSCYRTDLLLTKRWNSVCHGTLNAIFCLIDKEYNRRYYLWAYYSYICTLYTPWLLFIASYLVAYRYRLNKTVKSLEPFCICILPTGAY